MTSYVKCFWKYICSIVLFWRTRAEVRCASCAVRQMHIIFGSGCTNTVFRLSEVLLGIQGCGGWRGIEYARPAALVRCFRQHTCQYSQGEPSWKGLDKSMLTGRCTCESCGDQHPLHLGQTWWITWKIILGAVQRKMDGMSERSRGGRWWELRSTSAWQAK